MKELSNSKEITIDFKQNYASKALYQAKKFIIPEGAKQINITMNTPDEMWLTAMVYDSHQQLRAQFMNLGTPQPVIIHTESDKTSPYTIYGTLPSGEWTLDLVVVTNRIFEADQHWCRCEIDLIDLKQPTISDRHYWQNQDESVFKLTNYDRDNVINDATGWYKGDFHTHTIYSDGKMTQEENMISAKRQHLDFFFATDHHIVPTIWFEKTDILVIPGVEVTAPLGHYNILGTTQSPFSNQVMTDMLHENGMNKIMHDNYGNSLVSINHPFLTEWKWLFKETPLASIDCIEIWNDPTYPENAEATEEALVAWNILLNDGYRMTGIAGSDAHLKPDERYEGAEKPSLIGDPGTFVHCDYLSEKQVIDHVRAGHVTVSRGERIDFYFEDKLPGDLADKSSGTVNANVSDVSDIYFEWIVNGEVVQRDFTNNAEFKVHVEPNHSVYWVRVNVRNNDGSLYGFTNPIYFKEQVPKLKYWGELLTVLGEDVND